MNFFTRTGRAAVLAVTAVAVAAAVGGSLTDNRDGKTYKTTTIGGKTWMAENLNYKTPNGSWCYGNDDSKCEQYGRLYDWNTAKNACPAGWSLPSRRDWMLLSDTTGGVKAGTALKTKSGWPNKSNGTDAYGFSALPGGSRAVNGSFGNAGNRGIWWVGTEFDKDSAYYRRMGQNYDYVYEGNFGKKSGFSVRCVEGEGAAKCGGKDFDDVQFFCHKNKLVERCGFCMDRYDAVTIYDVIANKGNEYNPETEFCEMVSENDGGCDDYHVFEKCGGKEYSTSDQFCHNNTVFDKCGGCLDALTDMGVFNPATQFCLHKTDIVEKCGGQTYNEWQSCDDNNKIKDNICGGKKYNSDEYFCHQNNLYKLCECSDECGVRKYQYNPNTQQCGEYCEPIDKGVAAPFQFK